LKCEPSQGEQSLSTPSPERLRTWQLYFQTSLALIDVLGAEFERDTDLTFPTYDVLIHLEDDPNGLRMNDLAERILYSKSGLTHVVDRLERDGYVQRVRPENDRRSIFVVLTDEGRSAMEQARLHHRHSIQEHFARHLTDADIKALNRAFGKLREHARPLRPGRIKG
jgi:DNA-binding MarR family transcriptional regulator